MNSWPEALAKYPEANFLQSPEWGKVNELIGHKVILERGEDFWCQTIVKDAKRGRYLEIPGGPLVDWSNTSGVKKVFQKIQEIGRKEKCVFVRIRPQLKSAEIEKLQGLSLRKAPMHLHAEHTIIIDLQKSADDLLKDMRRQTRYEVRRADKLGIKVDWSNSEQIFREFQTIQAETAVRRGFVPPSLKVLLAEREAFADHARIYVARTDTGEPIAYGLILMNGEEAEYFEAASTELNQRLPGAYALQWRVIRDLQELGYKRYNLWGIAPPGQPNHRYARVTTFKKGFGGEVVEFVPAQDLVLDKVRYQIDLLVETLRRKRRKL